MAKKKAQITVKYRVLIDCKDKDDNRYKPGDTITENDFPVPVIDNWLTINPPVLEAL